MIIIINLTNVFRHSVLHLFAICLRLHETYTQKWREQSQDNTACIIFSQQFMFMDLDQFLSNNSVNYPLPFCIAMSCSVHNWLMNVIFPSSCILHVLLKPLWIFHSFYLQICLENLQRNPKAPDFKHKDTGEALWIEGRYNPPWVKSQLEILDSRMGSFASQNARMPVGMVAADEIVSF